MTLEADATPAVTVHQVKRRHMRPSATPWMWPSKTSPGSLTEPKKRSCPATAECMPVPPVLLNRANDVRPRAPAGQPGRQIQARDRPVREHVGVRRVDDRGVAYWLAEAFEASLSEPLEGDSRPARLKRRQ